MRDKDEDDLLSLSFPCKAKIKRHMVELKDDTFKWEKVCIFVQKMCSFCGSDG